METRRKLLTVCLLAAGMLLLAPMLAIAGGAKEAPADQDLMVKQEPPAKLEASALQEGFVKADFASSCAACHGSTPKYPVRGATLAYDTSGHKNNGNSYYANGGGCQRCHTNEGFIEYLNTGKNETTAFIDYPSQQGCVTCHTPHESWDFSLRTMKPVTLADGSVFDSGKGNLCSNCHQARGTSKENVKASAAKDIRPTWGAHHGPQADVIKGANAWQFAGKEYSNSPHGSVVKDGCVACHMSLPKGRYSFSPALGGHSFNVLADVHEQEKANNSGCLACHKDLAQVPGTNLFNIKAKADYDHDGAVEPVQKEVQGLLDAFVNEKGTGYLQTINPPMFKKDAKATFLTLSAGWAAPQQGQWSEDQVAALYNYKFFVEDRSLGVHNATYTIEVLYDSLKALDPKWDDSLRP